MRTLNVYEESLISKMSISFEKKAKISGVWKLFPKEQTPPPMGVNLYKIIFFILAFLPSFLLLIKPLSLIGNLGPATMNGIENIAIFLVVIIFMVQLGVGIFKINLSKKDSLEEFKTEEFGAQNPYLSSIALEYLFVISGFEKFLALASDILLTLVLAFTGHWVSLILYLISVIILLAGRIQLNSKAANAILTL